MKKLIVMAAAVVVAASVHASAVQWTSSSAAKMIDWTTLDGNGDYAAGGSNMRNNGTWAYVLTITDASTTYLSTSGNMSFGATGKPSMTLSTTADLTAGNTYNYLITITSSPAGLTGLASDDWDYSGASMSTTLSGTFAAKTGTSQILAQPSTWTVSGAVAKSTPTPGPDIPEPTSGLLLLVGAGMLALRRKQK